jgi:hypothetical protein
MRQATACHKTCFILLDTVLRAVLPDHRGPQAQRVRARPWLRELEARFTVAVKACGLCGQLDFRWMDEFMGRECQSNK